MQNTVQFMQTKLFVKGCGNRNSKIYSLKEVQKLGLSNSIENYKRKDKLTFLISKLKRTACIHLLLCQKSNPGGFGAKNPRFL